MVQVLLIAHLLQLPRRSAWLNAMFGQATEQNRIYDDKEEYSKLRKELEVLGGHKSELEHSVSELDKEQSFLTDNANKPKELRANITKLENTQKQLEDDKAKSLREIESLAESISTQRKKLDTEREQLIVEARDQMAQVSDSQKEAEEQLKITTKEVIQAQSNKMKLDNTLEQLSLKSAMLQNEVIALEERNITLGNSIATARSNIESILQELLTKREEVVMLDKIIPEKQSIFKTITESIETEKKLRDEVVANADQAVFDINADSDSRLSLVIQREGFLEKKEKQLREFKVALEEYHGKPINIKI